MTLDEQDIKRIRQGLVPEFTKVKEHCSELKSTVEALSKNLKIIKEVFNKEIKNLKAANKLLMQRVQTLEDG